MAGGTFGGAIDLRDYLWKVDYDPTQQISSDPSQILGKGVDMLSHILQELPKVAIKVITTLLTVPGKLAELVVDFAGTGLEALADWATELPLIGPLVEAIIGIPGQLPDLSQWFGNLEDLWGGIDFSLSNFDPLGAITTFINERLKPVNLLAPLTNGMLLSALIPGLDASKITGGTLIDAVIPILDQAKLNITNLAASVIKSGTLAVARIPAGLSAALISVGQFAAGLIPGLDASKITGGTLLASLVPQLPLGRIDGLQDALQDAGAGAISLTATIIDALDGTGNGLAGVTSALRAIPGGNLLAVPGAIITGLLASANIPGLDASKITSGQLLEAVIPVLNQAKVNITNIAANLVNGALALANIPPLPAGQITTGTFLSALIPGLDASKITGGSLLESVIPVLSQAKVNITNLAASVIQSGTLAVARIPSGLSAALLTTGQVLASLIPGLDASKITGGTFLESLIPTLPQLKITGLPNALGSLFGWSTEPDNLVTDPGFEDTAQWPTSRRPAAATFDTTQKWAGAQSLRVVADGTNKTINFDGDARGRDATTRARVKPGQRWYFAARIRPESTNVTGTGSTPKINVSFVDSTGTNPQVYYNVPLPTGTTPPWSLYAGNLGQWILLEGYYQVPDGYDRMYGYMTAAYANDAVGNVYNVDELVCRNESQSQGIIQTIQNALGGVGNGLLTGLTNVLNAIPGGNIAGQLLANVIPGLDASKITGGQLLDSVIPVLNQAKVNITNIAAGIVNGALALANIPPLPAGQITSGTFLSALIPGLDASKITGGTLLDAVIPVLDQAKVNITNLAASVIQSGTLAVSRIPSGLSAALISVGQFAAGLIPGLDASKITGGSLLDAVIPNLNASKITAGLFPMARLGVNDFENLVGDGGFESDTTMPWTTGTGRARVTGAAGDAYSGTGYYRFSAGAGGAGFTGGTIELREGDQVYAEARVRKSADYNATDARIRMAAGRPEGDANMANLYFRPSDINAAAAAQGVPDTDSWVLVSGTFGPYPANTYRMSLSITMTGLTAGTLDIDSIVLRRIKPPSLIANLPGSKIISQLAANVIPALNASIINAGQFVASLIPGLDASKITGGTLLSSLVPQLPMARIDGLVDFLDDVPVVGDLLRIVRQMLSPGRLPQLPLTSIADISPNLLPEGGFDTADTVNTADGWTWDGTVGRTSPLGSARVVANGTLRELYSDDVLVTQGQELSLGVWLRWVGLTVTGSGAPMQLTATAHNATGGVVANLVLQSVANSPGAASSNSGQANFVALAGTYTVPAGVAYVRLRLRVTANATAGTIHWDDASVTKTQRMPQTFVGGLVDRFQSIIDGLWGGITQQVLDGPKLLSDLVAALSNIPPINIGGLGGLPNLGETIVETWNQLWGGFARQIGAGGKSIADAANAASNVAETADQAQQIGEWNNAILGIRDANGFDSGMDPTVVAMYQLPMAGGSAADPPTVDATAAQVPVAFWLSEDDAVRGSVVWYGKGNANITAFYVDVYSVNKTTGQMVLLHSSPDQYPNLSANWKVLRYNMVTANRVTVAHGDVLAFAFRVQGTGTHQIAGHYAGWLPSDTSQVPQRPAARRTGVGTIALSSLTYAGDIPWVGVGIVEGDIAPPFFAPRTTEYSTPGAVTYQIPTWATYLDVIMLSAGAGGHGGNGGVAVHGISGLPGAWTAETLQRGVDFPANATQITLDVGAGGSAGPREGGGGDGGLTRRRAISSGKAQLSVAGGLARDGYNTSMSGGGTPGNYEYRGITYAGGTGNATSPSASNGQNGIEPGGGGAGGAGGFYGAAWAGGKGGRGGAWVVARQS